MRLSARFKKRIHYLVIASTVLTILVIMNLYRITGDVSVLVEVCGWLVALMYEYAFVKSAKDETFE